MYSKVVFILLMTGILLNNGGCVAVGHGAFSRPTFAGDGADNSGETYPVLNLPGVAIQVVAHNSNSFGLIGPIVPFIPIWERTGGSPFLIGVHLKPHVKEFVFAPLKVVLELEGGQLLLPQGFTGPLMVTEDSPKGVCYGSFDPRIPKSEPADFFVIGEMCFGILYEIISPKAHEKFSVLIGGLERKDQSVNVPKIAFEKRERGGWSICLHASVCMEHWTVK